MTKAKVQIGYSRSDLDHYRTWSRQSLVGVDVKVVDGLGNEIEISARQSDIGYRITVNGKEIACEP